MITPIDFHARAGCRAPLGLAAIGFVVASAAGGAAAQGPCTTTGLPYQWACELQVWLQESASGSPVSTHNDHFGTSAAGWGDFDGDGFYDILIGGMQDPFDDFQGGPCSYPDQNQRRNKAWIIRGSAAGLCTPPCNLFTSSVVIELRDMSSGNGRGDNLGWRFCFIGNIDGVAGDEIAVSAPMADQAGVDAGTVYVLAAGSGLPSGSTALDPEAGATGVRVLRIRGLSASAWLGFSIGRAGQIVGDSTLDLLIGSPGGPAPDPAGQPTAPETSGRAYVVDGHELADAFSAMTGLVADFDLQPGANCIELKGNDDTPEVDLGARFGYSLCAIGDITGDGVNEFAVGAIESWWSCIVAGDPLNPGSFEFLASPKGNGIVRVFQAGDAYGAVELDSIVAPHEKGWFGSALASGIDSPIGSAPGDVDGDTIPDLLIGAPFDDGPLGNELGDSGAAYLYSGADLDDGGTEVAIFTVNGDTVSEHAGWSLALGGKLNDDELAEFSVCSRNYSTGDAPDNGNGQCLDLVEAQHLYDPRTGSSGGGRIGRVRVYCGAAPHVLLAEFYGIQSKAHLGYAHVWLPPMEGGTDNLTELLMTMVSFAGCVGSAPPGLQCQGDDDPESEIGRAHIARFAPTGE